MICSSMMPLAVSAGPSLHVSSPRASRAGRSATGPPVGAGPAKLVPSWRPSTLSTGIPLHVTTRRYRPMHAPLRVAEASRGQVGRSGDDDEDDAPELPEELFSTTAKTKYRRVMLKISGEALQGSLGFGVDPELLRGVARDIAECQMRGVQMAIVVGGGNYFRGVDAWDGLDRATADYVGMMATCMNAICLQSTLESLGVPTRVQTAIEMKEIAEPYIRRKAVMHLEKGRVVIFGAGTGNPFFTTDTAAALRAAEIDADVLMKATKVDGVYDSDPVSNPDAKRYDRLSYKQVTNDGLNVMDETAITLCKENQIPCVVFNLLERGNVIRAVFGEDIGTTVDDI